MLAEHGWKIDQRYLYFVVPWWVFRFYYYGFDGRVETLRRHILKDCIWLLLCFYTMQHIGQLCFNNLFWFEYFSCVGVAWGALFTESTCEHSRRVHALKYSQLAILLSVNVIMITEKFSHSMDVNDFLSTVLIILLMFNLGFWTFSNCLCYSLHHHNYMLLHYWTSECFKTKRTIVGGKRTLCKWWIRWMAWNVANYNWVVKSPGFSTNCFT